MRRGFTLIELSVVMAIIAVILGGGLSILVAGTQAAQYNATINTMNAIEQALQNYVVAFNRLPCPSSLTTTATSQYYGVEAANPGTGNCTGGTPAANSLYQSTGNTYRAAEGGVPTVSLKLPDSYMYDAWGHRIRYAVDTHLTAINTTYPGSGCTPSASNTCIGTDANAAFPPAIGGCTTTTNMTVYDYTATYNAGPPVTVSGGNARSASAAYVLLSHGANGHGAYTSNGQIINAGSTNNAELVNCHCTAAAASSTYSATYVQEALTTATANNPQTVYDDIVAFKEPWQLRSAISPASSTAANCTDYGNIIPITINSSYVSTVNHTNLTNFPFLFSGTYSYLATTANGGYVQNANGYDIVFTSDSAGKKLLPFERESYSPSNGKVTFWINIPTVNGTSNTTIYLSYGNAGITTDQSNKTGTWNSNYSAVWHLDETSGYQYDSTSNANTLGGAYAAEGETTKAVFGGADQFVNSSQSTYNGSVPANFISSSLTNSAWVNMTTFNTGSGNIDTLLAADSLSSPGASYVLYINSSQQPCFDWINTSGTNISACGSTALSANTWYYFVGTYTPSTISIYVNGSLAGTATPTGSMYQANQTYGIGCNGNSSTGCSQDYIDETRVINTALSPDWIITEYNNQKNPSTFYTVGSVSR